MTLYAVIGNSRHSDVTVGVGPFASLRVAGKADEDLSRKGWTTEMVTLLHTRDIPRVDDLEAEEVAG